MLLLGPEAYERRRIKEAHDGSVPRSAVAQHDLAEMTLAEVLDDARALSLFASERLIWVVNAEARAAQRLQGAAEDDERKAKAAAGVGDGARWRRT